MNIAVISDIHGNLDALTAVMKDIEKKECEKIFVLGDYALAGPEPGSVVDYFAGKVSNPKYKMIQGNTDFMIANFNDQILSTLSRKAPIMSRALQNDVDILTKSQKDFLRELPVQIEEEIEGVKFLLVHGSPRKNNEDILPDTPVAEVESMCANVEANVVLCGHTHIPTGFYLVSKKAVVNAGSVGRPFTPEPKACYLIIHVNNGEYAFEHIFVEYNKEHAAEVLANRRFDGALKLSETLLNPQVRHF